MDAPLPIDRVREAARRWPGDLARAVFRSQEAALFNQLPVGSPAVDLGCGTGAFASLLDHRLEVGMDNDPVRIDTARRTGRYRCCLVADLRRLPFATESVATAIANSVLEHVSRLPAALSEIHRVLMVGGELIFTVPTVRKRQWLLVAELAEESGAPELADLYRRRFDARWRHLHYLSAEEWVSLLGRAGFQSVTTVQYEGRAASHMIDALNNLALRTASPGTDPLDRLRSEVATDQLLRVILPAVRPVVVEEGANVLCRAVK